MWDLIVSVPDHCLSFYFESQKLVSLFLLVEETDFRSCFLFFFLFFFFLFCFVLLYRMFCFLMKVLCLGHMLMRPIYLIQHHGQADTILVQPRCEGN